VQWNPSKDLVAGYEISRNSVVIGRSTVPFFLDADPGESSQYVVRTLGLGGSLSEPERVSVMTVPPARVSRFAVLKKQATSAEIVWSSTAQTAGALVYGTDPSHMAELQEGGEPTREHAISLKDLHPDTIYYYAVKAGNQQGPSTFFKTPHE
jgi:hypothetical protein